ncbi:hypothetical protein GGS23DRAFT_605303 [Durotheca rogersii]|uniref:uncharacterized protein n=1 Tax=Durotheca rogersii TaxID=419775 RepID=UPI00221EF1DE|nr:uncharacterized protein GGS23DRAFT_605303 [Durotheca rogersii]KAI5863292.1 hypothetical protein GGS23DRAFT_605303 [Durotheca rogersii]
MLSPLLRRAGVVVALLCVYALGANALYGLLFRNGYYDALIRLRDEGPHHLPGTTNPILTRYTGIGFLDKLLTLATVMFANVTDGSSPQLSLYSFHFAGQYLAILIVTTIEGLRRGNQSNTIRFFSVWACLMQATSYGCTMPLYGIFHFLTSPTAEEISPRLVEVVSTANPLELSTLSEAFTLGYVVPAVLMCVPLFSNRLHQWFGGLWQGSPIFAMLLQKLFAVRQAALQRSPHARPHTPNVYQPSSSKQQQSLAGGSLSSVLSTRSHEKRSLAKSYLFAFVWCILSQVIPLALIAAVYLRPSMFPARLSEAWTITNVFVPHPFWSTEKMESMATGMHDFFLYDQYIGSTGAIIWAYALYVNARERPMKARSWAKSAFVIVTLSLATGPAGAVVWLMWERDQSLLSRTAVSH